MLYLILHSNLGNQLFELINILQLSDKYNLDYKIYCNHNSNTLYDNKKTYFNNLYSNIKNKLLIINVNEIDNNYNLINYIDNIYNFEKYNIKLYNLLNISSKKALIKQKFSYILNKKNIAIHFKFKNNINSDNIILQIQTIKYYYNSINTLKNLLNTYNDTIYNYNLLFFCSENDNDIVNKYIIRLDNIFHNKLNFIKINDSINDWEQMLIISLCKYIIISNSFFSLWSALLSDKTSSVMYPNKLKYNKRLNFNMETIIPLNWICIDET